MTLDRLPPIARGRTLTAILVAELVPIAVLVAAGAAGGWAAARGRG